MSIINICKKGNFLRGTLSITGSKSISNRLLILQYLYKNEIFIENLSNCEDTLLLKKSLNSISKVIDVNHAGTTMRFLTSYFSIQKNKNIILTGSTRMKQRPISILVDALNKLGAKIIYLEKKGYPPIQILGKKILGGYINIDARISSQFISSLMLISSKFKMGLKIFLKQKITSYPYIKMTFDLLNLIGVKAIWENNKIHILPGKKKLVKHFYVESDWSSASYFYSMVSMSKKSNLVLSSYNKNSFQGDNKISYIYDKYFGVSTVFGEKNKITLSKNPNFLYPKFIKLDLNETPDIAQTIAVTCSAMKIKCILNGLETLKIKETDRLKALKNELIKFGVISRITKSSLEIQDFYLKKCYNSKIKTYQDHRMAMSFASLALFYYPIQIEDYEVVNKSYPTFWNDLLKLGFDIF